MNCLVKEELVDYLFSEERSVKRAEMDAHFSVCGACRAKVAVLKRLRSAAAAVAPAPVSGGFTARLMRELEARPAAPAAAPGFKRLFRPAWGLAYGAFAAAIFLGAFFLTGTRAPVPRAPEAVFFFDGPATVNNTFPASAASAAPAVAREKAGGYIYTDSCATANCGIL